MLLCAMIIIGVSAYDLNSSKHSKHGKTAVTQSSSTGIAETGFQFAAVLNAQPPTTNKIIAEVACEKAHGNYACIFIGNNKGSVYCVGYNFAVTGARVREISGKRLSNAYCGL